MLVNLRVYVRFCGLEALIAVYIFVRSGQQSHPLAFTIKSCSSSAVIVGAFNNKKNECEKRNITWIHPNQSDPHHI